MENVHRRQIAELILTAVLEFKEQGHNPFRHDQMIEFLKKRNIPYYAAVMRLLKNFDGVRITHVVNRTGYYEFTEAINSPKAMTAILNGLQELADNFRDRKKPKTEPETTDDKTYRIDTLANYTNQELIEELRSRGLEIKARQIIEL